MSDTPGKQLMDFITEELLICDGEWLYDAEAKINEFLQEQKDVREHAKELNEAPKGAKCRRCGTEEIPLKRRIDLKDMGATYYLCWKCFRKNPREDWAPKT